MEKESLNIFDSIVSEKISEISSDVLDAAIDKLIDNDFFKDIPIIGIGFKAYTLTQKISESFFIRKVLRFLFQIKDIPKEKREKFVKELLDKKENQKAGETVLSILNRLDDINKASIIGRLLKATIEKKLSYSNFMRLVHIVDKVFIDDLLFLRNNNSLYEIDDLIKANLYQAGLLTQEIKDNRDFENYIRDQVGSNTTISPSFFYKVNEYGALLIKYGL